MWVWGDAPEHIAEIVQYYLDVTEKERGATDTGIASQIFDNADFGYYKVTIERPDRRKAQFTDDNIAPLRFDKNLKQPMEWMYATWGNAVYEQDFLVQHENDITTWCTKNGFALNTAKCKKLLNIATWQKHATQVAVATVLMDKTKGAEYSNFNVFKDDTNDILKSQNIRLSAGEKNTIFNAVSWYDEAADKVIKNTVTYTGDKLRQLLQKLGCEQKDLGDFGYYATDTAGQYIIYETASDLRDSETVPLKHHIHSYFKTEVKPHVKDAWMDLNSVKIGYEISFNKYFYRHKPLRSIQ